MEVTYMYYKLTLYTSWCHDNLRWNNLKMNRLIAYDQNSSKNCLFY